MPRSRGDTDDTGTASRLRAQVVQYLTTILKMSKTGGGLGLRNERELRTLAEALDRLISGHVAAVGDILIQRFKAVETAAADQSWDLAGHLELIPRAEVSSVATDEKEAAVAIKLRELKVAELSARLKRNRRGGSR